MKEKSTNAKHEEPARGDHVIQNWMRNRNTVEFLGMWESLNNGDFKPLEFEGIRNRAGLNSFVLTPRQWIENTAADTSAVTSMNLIIHDMKGIIEIGDTFKNPKFRDKRGRFHTFDRVVANPMWNQDWFTEANYDADELDRFPAGAGFPGKSSAYWGWTRVQ